MALREGYGTGVYNSGKYGIAEVVLGQATATATVTASATGKYVYGGQEYDHRLRDGYGTGRYGRAKYGQSTLDKGAAAVSVTSVVSRAFAERVRPFGAAEPTVTCTTTCSAIEVNQSGATPTPTATATAQGFYSATGSATANPQLSPTVSYVRIRPFAATRETAATVTQRDARYKWIPRTPPTDSWTEAAHRGD